MTLQNFWEVNRDKNIAVITVVGDCLEGAGVNDGDIVRVDLTKMPLLPKNKKRDGHRYADICLCFGAPDRDMRPFMMLKEYAGTLGPMQRVVTRYKQQPGSYCMNYQFEPFAILGVVYECYDEKGELKWSRDISGHPNTLTPNKRTQKSEDYQPLGKEYKSLSILKSSPHTLEQS